jgi:hypothetical protein
MNAVQPTKQQAAFYLCFFQPFNISLDDIKLGKVMFLFIITTSEIIKTVKLCVHEFNLLSITVALEQVSVSP